MELVLDQAETKGTHLPSVLLLLCPVFYVLVEWMLSQRKWVLPAFLPKEGWWLKADTACFSKTFLEAGDGAQWEHLPSLHKHMALGFPPQHFRSKT